LRELRAAERYADAWRLYQQLVAMRETSAEACLIGGQAAKKLGHLWAAKDALESSLEREPDGAVLGMTRFVLGEVMRLLGKPHEAIQLLSAFLDGLPEYPQLAPIGLGPARYNRGMALRQAGRLEDSLYDYHAACEEFRRESMPSYLCMALQNLAWVASLLGDAVQTRHALEEARPLCATPYLRWHQRLGDAFLTAINSNPLDPESQHRCQQHAVELCQVIYEHEGSDVPLLVRSQAYWLAGTISLDRGEIDQALHFGQRAIECAYTTEVADSRSLYDAADLLREAHAALTSRRTKEVPPE
jgi:tetratricopeptide (TPR) repeat protein